MTTTAQPSLENFYDEDRVRQLRTSPINGIAPMGTMEIDMGKLDAEATNPGSDQYSRRYEKRMPDIRESWDIMQRIVYPPVVCQHPDLAGRFLIIDGHGRTDEVRRRGVKKISAIVYPPLTLEQRICLREVLNAAQEPFDTSLVLKDLYLLAKERGLDVRNEHDLNSLLADLPEGIRKHSDKLKILARWPEDIANLISVDDDQSAGVLGIDKLKELDITVGCLRRHHPGIAESYEGEKLHRQMLHLYNSNHFKGGKTQVTLRETRTLLKNLPQDHKLVKSFIDGVIDFPAFKAEAEPHVHQRSGGADLVALCKDLSSVLTDVDSESLTAVERRSLQRTADMMSQVLKEV